MARLMRLYWFFYWKTSRWTITMKRLVNLIRLIKHSACFKWTLGVLLSFRKINFSFIMDFNKILLFCTVSNKFDLRTWNCSLSLVQLVSCRAHFYLIIFLHYRVVWHSDIDCIVSVGGASFLILCAVDALITLISITVTFSLWLSNTLSPHNAFINSKIQVGLSL